MKTSVLVTGVTGSGKSTICNALQSLGYNALDIESIDGLYELIDEKTGGVLQGGPEQIKDGVGWNCNKTKLKELVASNPDGLTFYCGGMSNTEEIWDVFDKVIILTVNDATSQQRLSTRYPEEFGSTQENRDWVLSWKHDIEQRWLNAGGIAISAEGKPLDVAKLVIGAVAHA